MRALGPALLASLVLLFAAGCQPELHGECAAPTDCPSGTQCVDGLCLADAALAPDGGSTHDGGPSGGCAPECTPGSRCESGACVPDSADVAIVAPAQNALAGAGPLAVRVHAQMAEGLNVLTVDLLQGTRKVDSQQTAQLVEGNYVVTFDLAKSTIASGTYTLKATASSPTRDVSSSEVTLRVDKVGPEITVLPPDYPQRAATHPAQGAFLRSELVTVRVTLKDEPAGPSDEPPQLLLPGVAQPVPGVAEADGRWRFFFDGRQPTFAAAEGPLSFEVRAKDTLGNESSKTGSVQLSRLKWKWTKTRSGNLGAAPALRDGLVFVGGEDHFVYALRRSDGSLAWEHDTTAEIVGHLTAGDAGVYASLADGHVVALDPAEQPQGARRLYRCPDGLFQSGLSDSASGAALATTKVSYQNANEEETLVSMSVDGRLRMWRASGFPLNKFTAGSCYVRWDTNVRSPSTEVSVFNDGQGGQSFLFGDEDNEVQRWSVVRDNQGVFDLQQTWSFQAGDKISAPLALGQIGNTPGVLAARQDGVVKAVDLQKNQLYQGNQKVLPNKVRAAPVHTGGFGFLLDQAGHVQKFQLASGQTAWTNRFDAEPRSQSADASLLLAQDGRIYVPSGPQVVVLKADGTPEWRYDTRPNGSGVANLVTDKTTPALGCDGLLVVTVNDNQNQGLVVGLITDSTSGLAQSGWPKAFHDNRNTSNVSRPLTAQGGGCAE